MPTLTRQIIKDVVSEEVKSATSILRSEISEVRNGVRTLEKKMDQKFDNLELKVDTVITQLTDIAGQFKKFDEEQTVLSGQVSDRTDRIEKLEVATFGAAAA